MQTLNSTPQAKRAARNSKASGFTLIELLVVIAIIAILAAILFPVFARARENARRSSCQSNVKNIGLGFRQYTQDYDEKYPPVYANNNGSDFDSSATSTDKGWVDILQPYIKSTQVFQCPSETTAQAASGNGVSDYWYNVGLTGDGLGSTQKGDKSGVSEAALDFVALTVLIGDGQNGSAAYAHNGLEAKKDGSAFTALPGTALTGTAANSVTGADNFGLRHLDGLNYGFADGHVKWFKSGDKTILNKVNNVATNFATTGQNPTFNVSK